MVAWAFKDMSPADSAPAGLGGAGLGKGTTSVVPLSCRNY